MLSESSVSPSESKSESRVQSNRVQIEWVLSPEWVKFWKNKLSSSYESLKFDKNYWVWVKFELKLESYWVNRFFSMILKKVRLKIWIKKVIFWKKINKNCRIFQDFVDFEWTRVKQVESRVQRKFRKSSQVRVPSPRFLSFFIEFELKLS